MRLVDLQIVNGAEYRENSNTKLTRVAKIEAARGSILDRSGNVLVSTEMEFSLEMYNANRCAIELKAGRRVGQLVFAKMDQTALNPYNGKYQGQTGATGSMIYKDFNTKQNPYYTTEYPSYMGMKEYDDDINLHSAHSSYPSYW